MVKVLGFEAVAEHVTFRVFILNRSHYIRKAVALTFPFRAYRDCKRQWVGALFILLMVVTH
jgi:hypothetical protein